jgi:hypothetical protein
MFYDNTYDVWVDFPAALTHSGRWAVWFGGWQNGYEEWQYAWQTVRLPNGGPLYLNYWRNVAATPDMPSLLSVQVVTEDRMSTCEIDQDPSTLPLDTGFVQQSVDISSCADGGVWGDHFHLPL